MRQTNRLRQSDVMTLGPGMHADGGGLYLCVGKSEGSRSWVFRWRRSGRLHDTGLGSATTHTLAVARRLAQACRADLWRGIEPVRTSTRQLRQEPQPGGMTFEHAAKLYIEAMAPGWKGDASEHQWRQSLTDYAFPAIGKVPVAKIETDHVMRVLDPMWSSQNPTAVRVRMRIERILGWATSHGHRKGDNPARWKGHLENLLPKPSKVAAVEHHEALPYREIPDLVTRLRADGRISARALEFLILTAARAGEVIGARWDEIDAEGRWWTIPAARMKADREHVVPLSDRARAILDEMRLVRSCDFIFPGRDGRKPLGPCVFRQLMDRLGKQNGETVHGLRSSFRDWGAEQTDYPSDLCELALSHDVGSKVEQAYRRSDGRAKRVAMMQAWADWCSPSDNVTVMNPAA